MSEFSLPRSTIPARLQLTQGDARPGEIYVMERVPHHDGLETVLEILNRPEGFFAFRPANPDGVLLVSKAHTVSLAVDRQPPISDPARLSAARSQAFEVTLARGASLNGWANIELPRHHARVLDYLNASTQPFFAVSSSQETHYVNRAHVLYARPVD